MTKKSNFEDFEVTTLREFAENMEQALRLDALALGIEHAESSKNPDKEKRAVATSFLVGDARKITLDTVRIITARPYHDGDWDKAGAALGGMLALNGITQNGNDAVKILTERYRFIPEFTNGFAAGVKAYHAAISAIAEISDIVNSVSIDSSYADIDNAINKLHEFAKNENGEWKKELQNARSEGVQTLQLLKAEKQAKLEQEKQAKQK